MQHHIPGQPIDLAALTPVERMELADVLYDSAMQEIEAIEPQLDAEQLAELDRRIDRLSAGQSSLVPWDDAIARLMAHR